MDGTSLASSRSFYESLLCQHQAVLVSVVQGCGGLPQGGARGQGCRGAKAGGEGAEEVYTAALAALCHVAPRETCCQPAKHQVALYVTERLLAKEVGRGTGGFLDGLQDTGLTLDTLKVLYSCCNVSRDACQLVVDEVLQNILSMLEKQVSPDDPVQCHNLELSLYLLSVLVIQLECVPDLLQQSAGMISSILLRSPAHMSAASLLWMELTSRGCALELHLEDFLPAALITLMSAVPLPITPPGHLGRFDALLTLLLQFVSQGAAADLLHSELWPSLWQRVAFALHLPLDRPIMEGETPRAGRATPTPDWISLSPSGLLAFLTIATHVFTAAPSQCIALMSSPTSVVLTTLGHLLTEQFLHHLDQRLGAMGELPQDCGWWLVLRVCQLLCFPFAVDVEEPLLTDVLRAFLEVEVVPHLALMTLSALHPRILTCPSPSCAACLSAGPPSSPSCSPSRAGGWGIGASRPEGRVGEGGGVRR
ncbi:serine/threonine-protein kinase 36-like [Leucoraja erinacea]|uniref:serine/threonine-protein kinase 36-like n=1 Tax=Leucoraja erinaceus TaxID=7782 RepID=UPI0024586CCD|nr:serine/threonine-protein kinase 36-like [Leucoraja erinacea]